ncbi:hypothetical protein ACFWFV_28120, partial [Streptomyces diastaticus]|uniref:hypothetical protein n=3 Tax=Streptomyces diastaticus TaxID=1956 RepID=UPI0036639B8E
SRGTRPSRRPSRTGDRGGDGERRNVGAVPGGSRRIREPNPRKPGDRSSLSDGPPAHTDHPPGHFGRAAEVRVVPDSHARGRPVLVLEADEAVSWPPRRYRKGDELALDD